MSDTSINDETGAILFGEKLVSSTSFKALFREGMALVEETAAYLDGQGRNDAKALARDGALAHATESMRLTTRLMQLASWLLLQRAVSEGEMTPDQARQEKSKVRLGTLAAAPDEATLALVPARLAELIRLSLRLQTRIQHLDQVLSGAAKIVPEQDNAVERQINRLRQAFSGRG
jgi:regulator of CtrA degradation